MVFAHKPMIRGTGRPSLDPPLRYFMYSVSVNLQNYTLSYLGRLIFVVVDLRNSNISRKENSLWWSRCGNQMLFLHLPKRNFLKMCILASRCAYVLLDIDIVLLFYFTNGRYIECLSLTYATNKSKTLKRRKKLHFKNKK